MPLRTMRPALLLTGVRAAADHLDFVVRKLAWTVDTVADASLELT